MNDVTMIRIKNTSIRIPARRNILSLVSESRVRKGNVQFKKKMNRYYHKGNTADGPKRWRRHSTTQCRLRCNQNNQKSSSHRNLTTDPSIAITKSLPERQKTSHNYLARPLPMPAIKHASQAIPIPASFGCHTSNFREDTRAPQRQHR